MTNNQLEKILVFVNLVKEKLSKLKLTFGLKILVAVAVLLVICYQLLFVYVQPEQYGIKVVRIGLNRGVQKEVYQAAARAAKEEAELKKIVQEGMVITAVEMEKGKAYVTRKIAEKDLYVRKIKAEADLLVQLAEAERVRLKNESLKGIGSDRMVGLKMADVYKGLDLIILASDGPHGVNPLNIDNMLKMYDIRKVGGQ